MEKETGYICEDTVTRIHVKMKWSDTNQKWLMMNNEGGFLLNDFWDCENIRKAFPNLNKSKMQRYEISIKKI